MTENGDEEHLLVFVDYMSYVYENRTINTFNPFRWILTLFPGNKVTAMFTSAGLY